MWTALYVLCVGKKPSWMERYWMWWDIGLIGTFNGCVKGVCGSFDPCNSLWPVLCLFSPWSLYPPTSMSPQPYPTKGPLGGGGGGGGKLFHDSFAIFLPFKTPFSLQTLLRPLESGGHHLYRCLGMKALWPLLLSGGLGQQWLGQGARAALCSYQQSGLQFPQTWGLMGGRGPHCMTEMR